MKVVQHTIFSPNNRCYARHFSRMDILGWDLSFRKWWCLWLKNLCLRVCPSPVPLQDRPWVPPAPQQPRAGHRAAIPKGRYMLRGMGRELRGIWGESIEKNTYMYMYIHIYIACNLFCWRRKGAAVSQQPLCELSLPQTLRDSKHHKLARCRSGFKNVQHCAFDGKQFIYCPKPKLLRIAIAK